MRVCDKCAKQDRRQVVTMRLYVGPRFGSPPTPSVFGETIADREIDLCEDCRWSIAKLMALWMPPTLGIKER